MAEAEEPARPNGTPPAKQQADYRFSTRELLYLHDFA
jgi:hypothetical protein